MNRSEGNINVQNYKPAFKRLLMLALLQVQDYRHFVEEVKATFETNMTEISKQIQVSCDLQESLGSQVLTPEELE